MTTDQTRRTMEHYVEALLSSGDFARYLAEDVTFTIQGTERRVQGREAVRQTITFLHEQAFHTQIEIKSLVCEGNRAAIEAIFVGTHVGEFEGIKPTHRPVRLPYSAAYELEHGTIRSLRVYFALDALVRELAAPAAQAVSA